MYRRIATTQPQNTPLPLSPRHNKLTMTSRFWRPFWPTHANCHTSVNRAQPALSVDAWQLARVGQNVCRKALPGAAMPDRRAPPPFFWRYYKNISLKILIILTCSLTILLIYIRSGLPAIFEAFATVLWPQRCAPWPKISSDH